ncbi:MAG: hypothetical protein HYW25_06245 [Candidatus Aenigmarchaeota archaeon]|nr:hypothetical protein [Candidatus Aenigmarchaeota archaeon]
MRSYAIIAVVAILIFANVVLAFNVRPSDDSVSVKIAQIEKIDVTVETERHDIFILSLMGEQPWMSMPPHMELNAGYSRTFSLVLSPFESTIPTTYALQLVVESFETGEKQRIPISVEVRSADATIDHISVENTAPASEAVAKIFLKNHGDDVLNLMIEYEISGKEAFLKETREVTLEPGEFRIVEDTFAIPECYPAGTYQAEAKLYYNNAEISSVMQDWQVHEKVIIVREKTSDISGLGTETGFLLRNIGNVRGVAEVSDNVWGSLFYSGDEPIDSQDGSYVWQRDLGPCESTVVAYNINYSPIAGVFFAIIGLWLLLFRVRSVHISKNILQKNIITRGAEYTVGVHVKSYSKAKDIVVKDFVPPAFDVKFAHGGIRPEITEKASGAELTWRFPHMSAHEERVLAYKLVPLFSVSGKVRLPRAHVSFRHLGRSTFRMSPVAHLGEELVREAEEVEGNLLQNILRIVRFGR